MTQTRLWVADPEIEKGPAGTGPLKNITEQMTPSVYHETRPSSYPRQQIRRTRRGWELSALDGWGHVRRWCCEYRYQVAEIWAAVTAGTLAPHYEIGGVS